MADTALKTANSGYLTRRLVDVAQDGIVRSLDCGTDDGILLTSRVEAGEVVEDIIERVMGRLTASPITDSEGAEIFPKGYMLTEKDIPRLKEHEIDQVKVRSVLVCKERYGFCASCFGRDLARGTLVSIGEAVGVIAAQSIGEPGTQLTMRTFHVGGAAIGGAQISKTEVRTAGIVHYENVNSVTNIHGEDVIMNKVGEIVIKDKVGVEKERYPAIYGAKVFFKHGDEVGVGDKLIEWDPFAIPILTEVEGLVKFEDLVVGQTVTEKIDSVTGLTTRVVVEAKEPSLQPKISIVDGKGAPIVVPGTKRHASYRLHVGANIMVSDGDTIGAGTTISKIARETTKTKDITGGLPRVAELFEARKPTNATQISDVSGIVGFGSELRGARRVVIHPDDGGEPMTYTIPKGRYVTVNEGDYIRRGDPIMDGPINPHDLLRVMGVKALARYIVDETQEVYRLQGVRIDDKHIEVIVSQMLKKVEVVNPGDSTCVAGDSMTKGQFEEINEKLVSEGEEPMVVRPILLGITKASLSTDSFISAASFQETTKVLTQGVLEGKRDKLRGLKENIIMGRLIPAGSGITSKYRNHEAITEDGEAAKDIQGTRRAGNGEREVVLLPDSDVADAASLTL